MVSIALTSICFTDYFIPAYSTEFGRVRGWGYYGYIFTALGLYAYVFIDMLRGIRTVSGGRRLELQLWLGGGCSMTLVIITMMALNAVTKEPIYIFLQPLLVIFFYAGTAYAITTYRIFDAYQILRVALNKTILVALVAAVAFGAYLIASVVFPSPVAFLAMISAALISAGVTQRWLDHRFQFFPQATAVRQAAFAAARRESRVEALEAAFVNILKGWGQTDHVLVLSSAKGPLRGGALEIAADGPIVKTLRQIHWATPERLIREKESPQRMTLARFIDEHRLGVLVIGESPTVTVLIGVGVAVSRRPFTYPQVTQLMELTSIFEAAFERAQLSVQMQHAEQLATVGLLGASLAHEIRNPLVSIKTFVQLLPSRHQDAAFRDKFFKLMGDEVARIDRLTEQLLDLASPRAYSAHSIELHAVLRAGLELVGGKASEKNVQIITEFEASPDRAFADGSAVKQVLLNLCLNAIQAMETREDKRWVKIITRSANGRIELIVSDNGPGIAPEMHARLFQPFQSTKSSGFGLGLAICRDILRNLNASITVDPPEPGRGATFRITFPCQP